MIINDKTIKTYFGSVIQNHADRTDVGVLSYGVSSFAYDIVLGNEFKIMRPIAGTVDPKDVDERAWENVASNHWIIVPPHSFVLAHSKETFKLPRDVTGIIFPKSTYARLGLNCFQTVIDAGFEGEITLEFANNTPNYIKMYANEGCAQIVFLKGEPCETSYADRKGKYMHQTKVTLSKIQEN